MLKRVGSLITSSRATGEGATSAPASYSTWDAANKNAGVVLSNLNRRATGPSGAVTGSVINTVSHATGKWYAELTVVAVGATFQCYVGIALQAMGFANNVAVGLSNASGWGYTDAGNTTDANFVTNGAFSGVLIPGYTTGSIIMIAYDGTAGKLWFGKNGTFNGLPIAGTGQAFSAISGNIFLACSTRTSGIVDLNAGSSAFSYSPPTGFVAWG